MEDARSEDDVDGCAGGVRWREREVEAQDGATVETCLQKSFLESRYRVVIGIAIAEGVVERARAYPAVQTSPRAKASHYSV